MSSRYINPASAEKNASLSGLYTMQISYLLDCKNDLLLGLQRSRQMNNCADWRGSDACSLCHLISARFSADTHDRARRNHLIGGGDASDPTAMRS